MRNAVRNILFDRKPPTVVMTSYVNPTPFIVSSSSEFDANYPAWGAYDGNRIDGGALSGIWASASLPASITIDFGSSYSFSKVEITGRSALTSQSPNSFVLESSADGITFTTFASYTGQVWTASETKTFTFPLIKTRYLRIRVSTTNGDTRVAIVLITWRK